MKYQRDPHIIITYSLLQNIADNEDNNEDNDTETDVSLSRLLRVNSSEWHYIFVACVCSLIIGGAQPLFAVLIADFLKVCKFIYYLAYYTISNDIANQK